MGHYDCNYCGEYMCMGDCQERKDAMAKRNEPKPGCQACLEKDDRYPHTCASRGQPEVVQTEKTAEYSGGSSDYYQVNITNTTTPGRPEYIAECNDIIEALGMNFAEGNAFKAIWRRAAQRTLGKRKAGAKDDGLYDAQKVEFFGARLVAQSKGLCNDSE